MAVKQREIVLDAEGIDEASEAVAAFLEGSTKFDHRGVLSARLAFENTLIRLREHFGEGTPATLIVSNRLGRPRLIVKVRGELFDPRESEGMTDWERSLLEGSGLRPSYAYRGGYNVVSILCPRAPMGSMVKLLAAVVLGVALSQAGMMLPTGVRTGLLDGLVTPLFDTYVGMLSGVAGPMVFLSVAWGVCGIGDMAALGRSGKALISRFMGANLLATAMAILICIPVIKLPMGAAAGSGDVLSSITTMLLGLLPTNMVKPFVEGNTLQIIVLSIAVGVAALALGDLTKGIRTAIFQLNVLVQFLMEQLCRLLPAFIVVMIVSQTWSGTIGALLSSWLPILVVCVTCVLQLALLFVLTSFRCHIPLQKLVRVCTPALVLSFTTASSSAAFGTMVSACKDDLGVDDDQVSFGVPLGMVLCKPTMPILLMAIMLYSAQSFGVGANILWYVRLTMSCLLFAIAVPPVPGGMLACYSMMLAGLGIPVDALAICTALDMLMDTVSTSGNVGSLILEVVSAAEALGSVDHNSKMQQ